MTFTSTKKRSLTRIKSFLIICLQPNNIIHLLVGLYLAIAIPLAAILNIWIDEAYSLNTTGKNIQYAIRQAIDFEIQPPLYFVLLNIWRIFSGSIFWARLFSVIAIALTIYLVSLLAKRYIPSVNPIWIVAIFAFNPFVIKVALEIRVYAFAMLLSALLLWLFFDGYLAQKPQAKARVLYPILAIAALYTQYYLACLLIANGIVLLILKRWQALKYYVLGMSLVALCFSPMLFSLLHQVSTHTSPLAGNFWQNFIEIQQSKVQGFLGNFSGLPQAILIYCYLLIFLLLLGFVFTTDLRLINRNHVAIWTINIISILFFSGVLVMTNGLLLFRHTVGIFIASYLGLFLCISLIKYPRIRNTIAIF